MAACPLCNEEFDSDKLLQNHMKSHDKLDEESHM